MLGNQVTRRIKVDLKDGQNDVEVKNLPTCLDESSVRVDGIGNAVIFDVIYRAYVDIVACGYDLLNLCMADPPTGAERKSDVAEDLLARKGELHEKLAILTRQSDILQEYSKTLTGKDTTSDQLESFLDVYSKRQDALDEKKRALNNEIKALEKEIREAHVKVNADAESIEKRGVRITIIVLAHGEGAAELSLTYVVSNASWTPQYDLRAFIASNPGVVTNTGKRAEEADATSSVELHYRASIAQSTGEDWTGVELTLSTASPLQGTNIPNLDPQWISERHYVYGNAFNKLSPPPPRMQAPMAMRSMAAPPTGLGAGPVYEQYDALMAPMEQTQAVVNERVGGGGRGGMRSQGSESVEGAVSTTFTIPGLSTIPSDSDDSQQTHKVSIAELEFDSVDFEWITVPKKIANAYLRVSGVSALLKISV